MGKGYASECQESDDPGHCRSRGSQQVEKSRWAARQRRGLHMLSGGSWHWDTVPSQYLGTKKAGLSPRGRNKLWKGSNSLRPPSPTEGDLCGQDQWHITAVPFAFASALSCRASSPYSAMNGEGGREGGKALGVGRSA